MHFADNLQQALRIFSLQTQVEPSAQTDGNALICLDNARKRNQTYHGDHALLPAPQPFQALLAPAYHGGLGEGVLACFGGVDWV